MKQDKMGRLMAKLITTACLGIVFFASMIAATPLASSELQLKAGLTAWAMLAAATFFFGFGWLTEEEGC